MRAHARVKISALNNAQALIHANEPITHINITFNANVIFSH